MEKNTMKANYIHIFLILLSLVASLKAQSTTSVSNFPDFIGQQNNRRILHQPLFPASSPPPPELLPPPPPPPTSPDQDQPFFHELPTGPTLDQGQQSPPPATSSSSTAVASSANNSQRTKKLAIAVTSGILAVGVLSALAFYLYKRRIKHTDESQKLVGGTGNSQRTNQESRMPPSTFLYIGTVEPSATSIVHEANGSPYRKLNPGKRSSRYRPSPELHPLPPLTKPPPPPPPSTNSPPPMLSSDGENNHTNFYTPQESCMSNESTSSHHSQKMDQTRSDNSVASSIPHSNRTSPKSRLSPSSPDKKPVIIPSVKQSLPPSPPPSPLPPTNSSLGPFPIQPPPPPPPPQLSVALTSGDVIRPAQSKSQGPIENVSATNEHNQDVSLSEKVETEDKDGSKPKLKPLHWDKVRAASDRVTVWDQLNSSSFPLNEDAMESLFGCNSANSVPKEATRKSGLGAMEQENRVLDPKKSQNIAILLRALNVTREEVSEALLDGNPEGLGPELLETLVKMAPTKEEEIKLKDYNGETSKLGPAERFLKAILDIPFAFRRVEALLYRANFDTEVAYLRKSFQSLEEASEELKNSRLFLKLIEAVLRTGNRMNDGTNRGDAKAFKLDTLLKLVDVKGTDGKTTLLHFVVQEIIRSEGADSDPASESLPTKTNFKFKEEEFKKQGLQVVSGLSKELRGVKKAAGMDSDVLSSYVSKLEMGLEKIRLVMQYERQSTQGKFFDSMKEFLNEAVEEITRIKAEERKALSLVKEATEYFHGDAAKEEAHPFRIFVIVRDFLAILDNVCKDVERMQDRATVGSGRSFRMPATASLPVLNRYHIRHDRSPDDSM